jgi:hypothetical protein
MNKQGSHVFGNFGPENSKTIPQTTALRLARVDHPHIGDWQQWCCPHHDMTERRHEIHCIYVDRSVGSRQHRGSSERARPQAILRAAGSRVLLTPVGALRRKE